MGAFCVPKCKVEETTSRPPPPNFPLSFTSSGISVEDFDVLQLLGRGAFGKVFLVNHKVTQKMYAMKVINKFELGSRNHMIHTKTEREILASSASPFIIKLHFSFQSDEQLFMVMEYAKGGSLIQHLRRAKRFEEQVVQFFAAQILIALDWLHSRGYIYRDLKPENVLLDELNYCKLTDFGLSKTGITRPEHMAYSLIGTPGYTAPEILREIGHSKAVDYWSLGVMLFELLTGRSPFDVSLSENMEQQFEVVMKTDVQFPSMCSPTAIDLISKLLVRKVMPRQPDNRLSDFNDVKRHPFFSGIDWTVLASRSEKSPYTPPHDLNDEAGEQASFLAEVGLTNDKKKALFFQGFTMIARESVANLYRDEGPDEHLSVIDERVNESEII
jgi:protein-serine/threonine kinase